MTRKDLAKYRQAVELYELRKPPLTFNAFPQVRAVNVRVLKDEVVADVVVRPDPEDPQTRYDGCRYSRAELEQKHFQ